MFSPRMRTSGNSCHLAYDCSTGGKTITFQFLRFLTEMTAECSWLQIPDQLLRNRRLRRRHLSLQAASFEPKAQPRDLWSGWTVSTFRDGSMKKVIHSVGLN